MIVACVLRSGGVYTPAWVKALAAQVRRHLPLEHRFVCLTDVGGLAVETVPLNHAWPGWHSKLELFRPGVFESPVLYFDLDTLLVGPIGGLAAYDGPFAILEDFYRPGGYGSGVMAWTPSERTEAIYKSFAKVGAPTVPGGDQAWIEKALERPDFIQRLYPGQVVSYKADHCQARPPAGARVIAWHGQPKPNNCGGWAEKAWKEYACGSSPPADGPRLAAS